jgi:hypothetical protein
MSETVIVALLSLVGTVAGSALGVIASNKLVQYRLEQLERKVQAHNNLIERTYKIEGQLEECQHDIRDLKSYHKHG